MDEERPRKLEMISGEGNMEEESIRKMIRIENLPRQWEAIKNIPTNQRRAFLLKLERDVLNLFKTYEVCTLKDVASVMEYDWDDFHGHYKRMPLADDDIAKILQLVGTSSTKPVQQVANLRAVALRSLRKELADMKND